MSFLVEWEGPRRAGRREPGPQRGSAITCAVLRGVSTVLLGLGSFRDWNGQPPWESRLVLKSLLAECSGDHGVARQEGVMLRIRAVGRVLHPPAAEAPNFLLSQSHHGTRLPELPDL